MSKATELTATDVGPEICPLFSIIFAKYCRRYKYLVGYNEGNFFTIWGHVSFTRKIIFGWRSGWNPVKSPLCVFESINNQNTSSTKLDEWAFSSAAVSAPEIVNYRRKFLSSVYLCLVVRVIWLFHQNHAVQTLRLNDEKLNFIKFIGP